MTFYNHCNVKLCDISFLSFAVVRDLVLNQVTDESTKNCQDTAFEEDNNCQDTASKEDPLLTERIPEGKF